MQNALTLMDEIESESKQCYCSIPLDTADNKKKVFKISNGADNRVQDYLGKEIMLKDVFLQKFPRVNDETGEVTNGYRVILIDENGVSYASGSHGLYNSVLRLMSLLGMPTEWEKPLAIVVNEVTIKNGKTFQIEPVLD